MARSDRTTMAILITGATGLIGTALVAELRRQGESIVTTARRSRLEDGARNYVAGDPVPSGLFDGITQVVHLAGLSDRRAHSPAEYESVNHLAAVSLAAAAAEHGVQHFLFASSVFVHGDTSSGLIDVHSPLVPADSYARAKRDAEHGIAAAAGAMRVTIMRFPLVLAERVARRELAERIVRIPVVPVPSPPNERSFVRRADLVAEIAEYLRDEHASSRITIPEPSGFTGFGQTLRAAAQGSGAKTRFLPLPRRVFGVVDAVARRAGRGSIAGLYADFKVVGSQTPLH